MENEIRYERNPDFVFRRIVDESVLVPIHRDVADMNCIYTLNSVGSLLWEKLAQPATWSELQETVMDEYAVDPETLSADLGHFIDEMTAIGAMRKV